jgi:hypothetical protein
MFCRLIAVAANASKAEGDAVLPRIDSFSKEAFETIRR